MALRHFPLAFQRAHRSRLLEAKPESNYGVREDWNWYGGPCQCGVELGTCKSHPRARQAQRPPEGEWNTWFFLGGRGTGKTAAGAHWINDQVEHHGARWVGIAGPTVGDIRGVMIEGESGILAVSRPDFRPTYEPSKRKLTWPNGATAITFSAEEPDRFRGYQSDLFWADEVGSWAYPDALSNLRLGLRLGKSPRLLVTTTPKPTKIIKSLLEAKSTKLTRGKTHDNKAHLAPSFIEEIDAIYANTRLGRQEIEGILLEVMEGVWFNNFDPERHVTPDAEFDWHYPVYVAIDAGVSRETGAVFFQVKGEKDSHRKLINVFGDYHAKDQYSLQNAEDIRDLVLALTVGRDSPQGRYDFVRVDPASNARTGVGPAAFNEYATTFGPRVTDYWPQHRVLDGLDQIELLLGEPPSEGSPGKETELIIHPRCEHLIAAFNCYDREPIKGGGYKTMPRDPNHPHEDLMDALRGGIRFVFPEGRVIKPVFRRVHSKGFF